MKYLVTSHAMAVVLDIDENFRLREHQIISHGYHYGIAASAATGVGDAPAYALVYRGGDSSERQDRPQILQVNIKGGDIQYAVSRDLQDCGDVHQMLHAGNRLWLTDTRNNRLLGLGPGVANSEFVFFRAGADHNHINSLLLVGDRMLALLHNKRHIESQIAILQVTDEGLLLENVVSLWDVLCHNVFVDGGRLLYNASNLNQIVVVDLAANRVLQRVRLDAAAAQLPSRHGHVKGMSVNGDFIVVGVSEYANRSDRRSAHGCLVFLDRRQLLVRAVVPLDALPLAIGNINEVRSLDLREEADAPKNYSDRDWATLRLARSAPLRFSLMRASLLVIAPVVRMRRFWRNRTSE